MDYEAYIDREVQALFTRERNVFNVKGKLSAYTQFNGEGILHFQNVQDITILANGGEYSGTDSTGSKAMFKEKDLVGICLIN